MTAARRLKGDGWPMVPLGEVTLDTQYGTAQKANEEGRGLPILRMNNLTSTGQLDLTDLKHVELQDDELETYTTRPGDLLFNRTNSLELVGKMAVWDRPERYAIAGYLVRVRVDTQRVDSKFIAHWFNTPWMKAQLRARAKPSINMANLSASEVVKFKVPVPSLMEQQRAVELLDAAHAMLVKRSRSLELFEPLAQAIFFEMFGDPVANPRAWRRAKFSGLLEGIDSGWSPRCLDRPATEGEWGVLKLGAVTWCEYDPEENKALPPDTVPDETLEVHSGDLLFARKNTHQLVAACALVRRTPRRLLLPDLIFRLKLATGAEVDPVYLHRLLITPSKRSEIQRLAGGSAGSMPNISKARLSNADIELPPLELQKRFAAKANALEAVRDRQQASLVQLKALFASLQMQAFRRGRQ